MIVALGPVNECYWRVYPHHGDLKAYWLSPGGLEYLRRELGYRPFEVELVPDAIVADMRKRGHLRSMRDAPPLGSFTEPFEMPQRSRACAVQ